MSGGFFRQKKTAVRKLPRRLFWESYKSLCKQSAVHFVGLLTHAFRALFRINVLVPQPSQFPSDRFSPFQRYGLALQQR